MLAVQSDGWAVQFVAPELCRDQEVVTLADFSGNEGISRRKNGGVTVKLKKHGGFDMI